MKQPKSNLDEMQEMKLLKIEHTCCWMAFWGLTAAIILQNALGYGSFQNIIGESTILSIVSVYFLIACLKNGIWDRKLKPNLKTNLLVSILTGGVVGVVWFIITYYRYQSVAGSFATFLFIAFFVGAGTMLLLSLTSAIYKKRKHCLDLRADREDK